MEKQQPTTNQQCREEKGKRKKSRLAWHFFEKQKSEKPCMLD
jgi:hypothetical protein